MIKEKFNLINKVAIITGSSKGIGKSMARGLAEFGANVVISSRKKDVVEKVASQFNSEGLSAIGIECHVAKEEQQKELIREVMEKYGRIDILINNAGTNPYFGPIDKMPLDVYQKTMDINVNSAISLSNLVYPIMKKQGGGSIINPNKMASDSLYNMAIKATITGFLTDGQKTALKAVGGSVLALFGARYFRSRM